MPIDIDSPIETPELKRFREEVRAFIAKELPADIRAKVAAERMDMPKEDQRRWHRILRKRGWACPAWPKIYGGPELSLPEQYILERELALADAPRAMIYGCNMLAPTVMKHGTEEQKHRFLPPMLNADIFWCQGFSEPNAGSDLASLQCRAERRGDTYVINGQKLWTSEGHIADWMFGVFRTDSSGKKQHGITFLVFDMKTPGIEVTPVWTYDGTGREVNQIFFKDVVVPVDQRIGEENKGWTVAKDLLTFERFGTAEVSRSMASVRRLRQLLSTHANGRLLDDPAIESRLVDLEIELAAIDRTELKIIMHSAGGEPGPEAALLKLRGTEVQNAILTLAMDVLGPAGLIDAGDLEGAPIAPTELDEQRSAARSYFNYRKTMIYGGSSEVQHNIIAKAVLGL